MLNQHHAPSGWGASYCYLLYEVQVILGFLYTLFGVTEKHSNRELLSINQFQIRKKEENKKKQIFCRPILLQSPLQCYNSEKMQLMSLWYVLVYKLLLSATPCPRPGIGRITYWTLQTERVSLCRRRCSLHSPSSFTCQWICPRQTKEKIEMDASPN